VRLPRVRLTVRMMMALVAVVAVLLGGFPLVAEWVGAARRYREMAAYCSNSEATYRSYERRYLTELRDFESGLRPVAELGFIAVSPIGSERDFATDGAAQSWAVAEHWARLKGIYVRASWIPWINLPDSLQHPIWENDTRPRECGPW
jgi:hypothetical protein